MVFCSYVGMKVEYICGGIEITAISIELIMQPPCDYSNKDERLKTFTSWPLKFVSPNDLAAAGFYYEPFDVCDCHLSSDDINDVVRCFSCGIRLMKWEDGDDPMTEHKKWSPSCKFVNNYHVDDTLDISDEDYRLTSFKCWPVKFISPNDLAASGFYYCPSLNEFCDNVRCFSCGIQLCKWQEGDDPMTLHRKFSPSCRFVNKKRDKHCVE